MFKRLAGADLFLGLQNQNFIKRYDRYISGPPFDLVSLSVLIMLIWLARPDFLADIAPPLGVALTLLPKYNYELQWLAEQHPDQVNLYTCLSFFLILITAIKTISFSSYIAISRLGRGIATKKYEDILLKSSLIILLFFSLLFFIPLPIYNTGAQSRLVGNAYILTAINIYLSTMLCGMISAIFLLTKRLKTQD
ncbi:hypothetical protein [Rhizobium leguminosarum]|uniref:hypothetical protein n=1 Tax=Rhizobium leguminosarum TaxID=384 RepID=UPI00103CC984|nr:hypothetical protein [Rhizobium leguminosarum]MBY5776218.1 hypothetical protein [Rhizobium leguminosarum]MBY5797193.1 hypothetical protein [Rhizobium leguminosarum]TBZ19551.1 hypothetical protein E0H33_05580 [Rhizobium leguminosarum bv. viciae]